MKVGLFFLIVGIIQYAACWVIYVRWFRKNITYCKMADSNSFLGMVFLLPFIAWIPILPFVVIYWGMEK